MLFRLSQIAVETKERFQLRSEIRVLTCHILHDSKGVHHGQKLMTDLFQTFWIDYFGCDFLNFKKKKYAYRGSQGVIF